MLDEFNVTKPLLLARNCLVCGTAELASPEDLSEMYNLSPTQDTESKPASQQGLILIHTRADY